jgi:hypothetical protein
MWFAEISALRAKALCDIAAAARASLSTAASVLCATTYSYRHRNGQPVTK